MLSITQLLERFRGVIADRIRVEEVVVVTIKELCGVTLSSKNIKFSNSVLTLSVSPATKQTIYIKKSNILKEIKNKLPTINLVDIL